jgi:hypothetical protein
LNDAAAIINQGATVLAECGADGRSADARAAIRENGGAPWSTSPTSDARSAAAPTTGASGRWVEAAGRNEDHGKEDEQRFLGAHVKPS